MVIPLGSTQLRTLCSILNSQMTQLSCLAVTPPSTAFFISSSSRHGACMLLNPDKCQLLRLHTDHDVSRSTTFTPLCPCQCQHCGGIDPLSHRCQVVDHATYVLDASASSSPDRLRRFSQASSAFRFLFPLFSSKSIPIKRRLQLHNQIVLAILLYGSESQTYTPAQLQRFNALHFKVLHQIFGVKSSYYHQVLAPSSDSCSNAFLARKAAAFLPDQLTPLQIISQKRLQYLGHIMRHPYSLEHAMIFGPSRSFLRLTYPYRRGAPRAHWYELAFTEAYHRVHLVTMNQHPWPYEIHHTGYRTATLDLHKSYQGSHMPTWFDNTKQFRQIAPSILPGYLACVPLSCFPNGNTESIAAVKKTLI